MTRRIGLPDQISEPGVGTDLFPALVAGALGGHRHKTNPREAAPEDREAMIARSHRRRALERRAFDRAAAAG